MNWPSPLDTAPREEQRRLFLFCPIEGWVAGEWFEGRWVDAVSLEHELRPTHWLEVPPNPPGTDDWHLQTNPPCSA